MRPDYVAGEGFQGSARGRTGECQGKGEARGEARKREARPQDVQMVGRGVPGRALSSKLGRCALALAGGWCRT